MTNPVRRTTLRAVTTALLGATLVVSTVLVSAVFASTAGASTIPPWEPIANPPEAGGLTFYNSSGQVITGGNISDPVIAAYIQGNTILQGQTAATVADLNGFDPTTNGVPVTAPGNWSEESLGFSNLPSSAPGALGTSTLPVYTDQTYSLSQLTDSLPNTDTSSTDGYAGMYVLRLQTFQHNNGGTTTSYDSADISVDPGTGAWTLVYSPQAATVTTLEAPTPAGPQTAGTSVTLTATVADASAPGTVQFESGDPPWEARSRSPTGRPRSRPPRCRQAPTPSPRCTRRRRVRRSPDPPAPPCPTRSTRPRTREPPPGSRPRRATPRPTSASRRPPPTAGPPSRATP